MVIKNVSINIANFFWMFAGHFLESMLLFLCLSFTLFPTTLCIFRIYSTLLKCCCLVERLSAIIIRKKIRSLNDDEQQPTDGILAANISLIAMYTKLSFASSFDSTLLPICIIIQHIIRLTQRTHKIWFIWNQTKKCIFVSAISLKVTLYERYVTGSCLVVYALLFQIYGQCSMLWFNPDEWGWIPFFRVSLSFR